MKKLHNDYETQIKWLRRAILAGQCEKIGTWSAAGLTGEMWYGEGYNYRWWFNTYKTGLVPGTFRVAVCG